MVAQHLPLFNPQRHWNERPASAWAADATPAIAQGEHRAPDRTMQLAVLDVEKAGCDIHAPPILRAHVQPSMQPVAFAHEQQWKTRRIGRIEAQHAAVGNVREPAQHIGGARQCPFFFLQIEDTSRRSANTFPR